MKGKHISCAVNNVDALSHLPVHSQKVALVTEGGGQRGIFTAGVLDAFLEANFCPFSLMIGTSAGSLNLASYLCGQSKHAYDVITKATTTNHFFDLTRFLSGKEGLDLDWLLKEMQTKIPLNWLQARERMRSCTVLACASHVDTHRPFYFDLYDDNWQTSLQASCSIPALRKQPVLNQKQYWIDGGLGAPIPVQEAYKRGYKDIVVIRTVPITTKFNHCWMSILTKSLGRSKLSNLISLLLEHEENYRRTQSFLNYPPSDVTIYEIYPKNDLRSKLIGSSKHSLESDYELGYRSGRYFRETLGKNFSS